MLRLLLAVLFTCAFPLSAHAAPQEDAQPALVQVRLDGRAGDAGASVRMQVTAEVEGRLRRADFGLFVAPGTSGRELSALVAARLQDAGVDLVLAHDADSGASLFLERATLVAVEVSGGVGIGLTACEVASASVRIEAKGAAGPAAVTLATDLVSPHDGRRSGAVTSLTLAAGTTAPLAATMLMERAAEGGLLSEKPGGDTWRPVKLKTGEKVQGLSVRLESSEAWRLELAL